jgi:GlpG protein
MYGSKSMGNAEASMAKGHLHLSFNSPVVLMFVALCFLATLLGQLSDGAITQAFFMTYRSSLLDPLMYVRLFTHVFGHVSWEHFVDNMTIVLLLGPLLEEKYGSRPLAEVMMASTLTTGLVNDIFFPHQALCGASGICFTFILLSSITQVRNGGIPLTFILVAVLFLGQQVVLGLTIQDNVSNLSHVIGGIVGAVAGFGFLRQ